MGCLCLATNARTRILFLRALTSLARSNAAGPAVIPNRLSSLRPLASDSKSSTGTQKTDIAKPHRSILEEVLIKEKQKPKTTAGKVVEKAENTFFYAILAAGIAALGLFSYVLFEQFFSYESPQKIFSTALKMIRSDERCQDLFGAPIAGFGEETGRGRRRHVAHQKYDKDGKHRIRVMFHLKGSKARGIAQAEMEYDGSWQWRFLLVQSHGPVPETHVLIDNREAV